MQGNIQQQYLKAMGVSSYVPRFRLPGALPSEPGDFPVDEPASLSLATERATAAVTRRQGPEAASAPDKKASAAARAALEFDVDSAPARASKPAVSTAPAAPQEADAIRFAATLVDSGTGLLFLVDLSHAELSAEQKRLLANIAKAVCRRFAPEQVPTFQASSFYWPMLKSGSVLQSRLAQGGAEAREAFMGFLLSHAERWQGRRVVVLAPALESFIADDLLRGDGLHILYHCDVDTLMQTPQQKAQLWQALCASF